MNSDFLRIYLASVLCLLVAGLQAEAQNPPALERFLRKNTLHGASVSLMVREVESGDTIYAFETERELTPASVMKTVTTATALEILGEDFRFETTVCHDGFITDSVLHGNIYIRGSGDPTINSSELKTARDSIIALWASAVKNAGIRRITGCIMADERIFDTEGVSMKWMREDLGSSYGQGSYGLNIFDNLFTLHLRTDTAGTVPVILYSEPPVPFITFHNHLTTLPVSTDSCYITGFPFTNERYLYGVAPGHRDYLKITGDIPDPALYAAQYFSNYLQYEGVETGKAPSCYRLSPASGRPDTAGCKTLVTTCSLPLREIVRITNHVSHNLYADALLKTLGVRCPVDPEKEALSSFGRGIRVVKEHWHKKGLNTASLWMHDGSGLAATDKVSAGFLCDLYIYMATRSKVSQAFVESLPQAGIDGTVRGMMKGSPLQGKARLKSGSMSRVRCYGGYVAKDGKQYVVAVLVNNFSGKTTLMRANIEELLLSLFAGV
jgi:D-alanyl-D-alanine carboxypeptidase/D-alanyl-D-alanine-endopeptidase (penicillin-binding protein 4)